MNRYSLVMALLAFAGCGPKELPFTDNSQDPDSYARDVKQTALNVVIAAGRSREPADQLRILVTELEEQEEVKRPLGQYAATYAELLGIARPLLDDCGKAEGRPPNLAARLAKLKALAETLPGTVQLMRTGG